METITAKKESWVFTFGYGMLLQGCCVRINGNYYEARDKLMQVAGLNFAFQYPAEEWDSYDFPGKEKEISFEEVRTAFKAVKKGVNTHGAV